MGIRKKIRDGLSGTVRSMAKRTFQLSSKSLERTSKAIQDLKSKMDERADSFLPAEEETEDKKTDND